LQSPATVRRVAFLLGWLEAQPVASVNAVTHRVVHGRTTRALRPDVLMACCGDVPTLETLAAASIMHEHWSEQKIRVVNVVDLMKLQPRREHLHG
jgi:phosphoketolase